MKIEIYTKNDTCILSVFGSCDNKNIAKHQKIDFPIRKNIIFDFSNLTYIDSAGVCYFLALEADLRAKGCKINKINLNLDHLNLFTLYEKYYKRLAKTPKTTFSFLNFFENIGFKIIESFKIFVQFLNFVGLIFHSIFKLIINPKKFRFISFLYHVEQSAINALPIIMLTSLLVGVVLAYQAAYQLAQFGANIYIVDLMGISATRELAPLIAAIVIAGRSASSYTAQIGVMKLTDEIDAMKTMGFKESEFIILPRVLALSLAMPFVVIVADILSVLGGIIIAWTSLEINAGEFMSRFKEAVELKHIFIGLIKAPIFGFLIASIACFRGFFVQKTTESIGVFTTKSVVNAIFWVIAFDAIFSVFLTKAGI